MLFFAHVPRSKNLPDQVIRTARPSLEIFFYSISNAGIVSAFIVKFRHNFLHQVAGNVEQKSPSSDELLSFTVTQQTMLCASAITVALMTLDWLRHQPTRSWDSDGWINRELMEGTKLLYGMAASVMWLRTLLFVFFQASPRAHSIALILP